jgi:hypothetical protein
MWIRRGLDNYLGGDYPRALLCYTHGGELGYEVSVTNAAYILQKKLISNSRSGGVLHALRQLSLVGNALPNNLFSIEDNDREYSRSALQGPGERDNLDYYGALYMRQLVVSSSYENTESVVKIGHAFVDGLSKLNIHQWAGYHYSDKSNVKAAIFWYSRAAISHHALSNLYLGAIHQFHCVNGCTQVASSPAPAAAASGGGGGGGRVATNGGGTGSITRARQYYKAALNNPALPGGFKIIAHGLLWLTDNLLELKLSSRDVVTSWSLPADRSNYDNISGDVNATVVGGDTPDGADDSFKYQFLSLCHNVLRALYLWYSLYL